MSDPDAAATAIKEYHKWLDSLPVGESIIGPAFGRRIWLAARAAERQRIAEGLRVAARHMGYSGEEVLTAAWPHLAESLVDLLDGDGDA